VILALPRGGVPVAAEVAAMPHAPLDLVQRQIGVPTHLELAMGAVVDGGFIVRNEDVIMLAGIGDTEFSAACDDELAEIERRRRLYLGDRERVDIADRVTLVIDNGIAAGATTRAALRATRLRKPKKLVLAVPVAPTETLAVMREKVDDVICLEDHEPFGAIYLEQRDPEFAAKMAEVLCHPRRGGGPGQRAGRASPRRARRPPIGWSSSRASARTSRPRAAGSRRRPGPPASWRCGSAPMPRRSSAPGGVAAELTRREVESALAGRRSIYPFAALVLDYHKLFQFLNSQVDRRLTLEFSMNINALLKKLCPQHLSSFWLLVKMFSGDGALIPLCRTAWPTSRWPRWQSSRQLPMPPVPRPSSRSPPASRPRLHRRSGQL